eukprot:scaffold179457_cov28-Tisochrysis_lutea.AAC.3
MGWCRCGHGTVRVGCGTFQKQVATVSITPPGSTAILLSWRSVHLHEPLAKCLFADDDASVGVLYDSCDDLSRRGGITVDEDHKSGGGWDKRRID